MTRPELSIVTIFPILASVLDSAGALKEVTPISAGALNSADILDCHKYRRILEAAPLYYTAVRPFSSAYQRIRSADVLKHPQSIVLDDDHSSASVLGEGNGSQIQQITL